MNRRHTDFQSRQIDVYCHETGNQKRHRGSAGNKEMSKDLGYLVIIGMLVVAIFLVYLQNCAGSALERKRSERIKAAANSLGLSFVERDDQVAQDVLANFSRARYEEDLYDWTVGAFNIMRGTRAGVQLLICDFKWSAGRRKSTGHFSTTLTHWRSSSVDLPEFLLVSLKHGTSIPGWSESQLVKICQPEAFANQYQLAAKSESAVRALFQPGVLAYFAGHPDWTVEGGGDGIVICKVYEVVKPERLGDFLNQCEEVCRLFRTR
jgi:hypothetical protein